MVLCLCKVLKRSFYLEVDSKGSFLEQKLLLCQKYVSNNIDDIHRLYPSPLSFFTVQNDLISQNSQRHVDDMFDG